MAFSYRKKLFLLIIISTLLRLIAAAFVELGNDEVYYWTYAQHLQWNYFDHPPMVAVWIRMFTFNLSMQNFELFVRLGSIISCIISTLLLYNIVLKLHSEKAAWFAVCLYNTCIYTSIIAGTFILPDSPQMVFWCGSLYFLIKILDQPKKWISWLLFGVFAGLCIMSKVHGIFIWFGFGLFVIFKKSELLKRPQLYVAALITALMISPILLWNISNQFITYRFHSGRVVSASFTLNFFGLAREIYGQIFYTNPINIFIIISALNFWRHRKMSHSSPLQLFNFIAVPMISVFVIISILGDTLPHWSGPAYVTLLPLAAIYLAEKYPSITPWPLRWSFILMIGLFSIGLVGINYYPGTFGKQDKQNLGSTDVTLDMYGWKQAGELFKDIYLKDQKNGVMPKNAPVVCYNWFPAAHEEYYFCHPLNIKLIGLGPPNNLHHYIWLNKLNEPYVNMQTAYSIVPSTEYHDARAVYEGYYKQIDSVTTISTYRTNKICRYFTVFRLSGWVGTILTPQNLIYK